MQKASFNQKGDRMTALRNASGVIRRLRALAADEVPDHQLLERFTVHHDDHAFAALVRRYGRLVCSVCRAVLHNEHDIEDVFQAAFLVLARKAASIRKRDALASWLYGVAYRLARKARSQAIRRSRPVHVRPRPAPAEPLEELAWREWNAALHEELTQLPAVYCSPVVLCCLEGHSRDEAAQRLGWPMGTVKTRLERGRQLLRERLAQRGLAPSAALAATLVTAGEGLAAPASLIQSTTAGILAGPGGAALSHRAILLAQGVLQGMFTTKLIMGLVLCCGVLLTLLAAGLHGPRASDRIVAAQETKPAQPIAQQNKDQPPGEETPQFPAEPQQGEDVMAVKFGATGEWMGTAETDGKVRLWNTKTQRPGPVLRGPSRMVRSIAFTPDSDTLVAGSDDGKIYVWDVRTGKIRTTLEGHSGWVCSIALASDGKTLASSARNFEQGALTCSELKIWDLARGKLVRDIKCQDEIASGGACGLVFAPGTDWLAAACCGEFRGIKVWSTTTGKEVKRFTYDAGFPLAVAISSDGKWLASGGDAIPVAPDASRLEGSLKVWDWGSGNLQQTLVKKSDGYFRAVAFSKDSTRLVAGSPGPDVTRNSNTFVSSVVHCWEVKTWARLWSVHGLYGEVWSLDISPDGNVASSDSSGTSVIDAALGRVRGYWMTTPRHVEPEEFGAARELRRQDWPNSLVHAVNLDSRVYSLWDSGTDRLFYRGKARAVNEAMRKFAAVTGDHRPLVLVPGSGETHALSGKPVAFDWRLHVPGGLDKADSRKKHAVMTVHVSALKPRTVEREHVEKWLRDLNSDSFATRTAAHDELQKLGNDAKPLLRAALQAPQTLEMRRRVEALLDRLPSFDLTDLEIPKGVVVLSVGDMIAQGLQELKDPDRNVRRRALQDLSDLARFSDKIVPALVEIFEKDKDIHIRQIAAVCLAHAGVQAKPALPTLKQGLDDPDANIRYTCQNALKRLASAEDPPDQAERIRQELAIAKEINEVKKATGGND